MWNTMHVGQVLAHRILSGRHSPKRKVARGIFENLFDRLDNCAPETDGDLASLCHVHNTIAEREILVSEAMFGILRR